MSATAPFVVVGAGPAGLVLALALARRGIAVDVHDAAPGIGEGSRALGLSRRTLQILGSLGDLGQRCVEIGVPWVGGRTFHRNTEVFSMELSHDENDAYPDMINLPQHRLSQLLVEEIEKTAGELVRLHWASTITAVRNATDAVDAKAVDADGTVRALRTPWLVGCDGPRSTVRTQVGARLEGESWDSRFVIVDVRLPSEHPAERRAWFDPPSNPGSTVLMHRQPDDVWRLDYQVPAADTNDPAAEISRIVARVREHFEFIGERGEPEVVWASSYRARALTAPDYRYGRVFLAGDAAHLIPIFGIRGMNSAVEDAHNLAWKLAAVHDGWAGPALLDSYTTERLAAAHENLRLSTRSTLFMAPPTPAQAQIRDAVLELVAAGHQEWIPVINPRQTGTVAFPVSPLHTAADPEVPAPRPGEVFRDARVVAATGSEHLSGHLDREPVLLCFTDAAGTDLITAPDHVRRVVVATALAEGSPAGVTWLADPDGAAHRAWCADPGDTFLVRPDGHLAARWRRPTASQIQEATSRLYGWPTCS